MKIANDIRSWRRVRAAQARQLRLRKTAQRFDHAGKVNPTQCEALTILMLPGHGQRWAIGLSAASGKFRTERPRAAACPQLHAGLRLLADGMHSFDARASASGNRERIAELLETR